MAAPEHVPTGRSLRNIGWNGAGFIIFMAALVALFVYLGNWQMQRLEQKTQILQAIESRSELAPQPMPSVDEWSVLDPANIDYLPITIVGEFDHRQTVLVFTNLDAPRGASGGPGYYVVAPFHVDGGIILVNRGFIPQGLESQFRAGGAGPQGVQVITGLARQDERVNAFTPVSNFEDRVEWVRNGERIAQFLDPMPENLAPFMLDQGAGAPGAFPQGGETRLTITNRHFEYAITWYALAIITPFMLLIWLLRQLRGVRA